MPDLATDLIDTLVGIVPGSPLDAVRAGRPAARTHSQASYRVLFTPDDPAEITPAERFAIGTYVAGLHGADATHAHYAAELAARGTADLSDAVGQAVATTRTTGPYGHYPAGPLRGEDRAGVNFTLHADLAARLGPRLAAAFGHAHLLVFHPRDAEAAAFQPLLAAGWSIAGIVTLSQIVAFLTYQIRVAAGLRVLAAHA